MGVSLLSLCTCTYRNKKTHNQAVLCKKQSKMMVMSFLVPWQAENLSYTPKKVFARTTKSATKWPKLTLLNYLMGPIYIFRPWIIDFWGRKRSPMAKNGRKMQSKIWKIQKLTKKLYNKYESQSKETPPYIYIYMYIYMCICIYIYRSCLHWMFDIQLSDWIGLV